VSLLLLWRIFYAPSIAVADAINAVDKSVCDVYYPPPNSAERAAYRTSGGKKISNHAWAVYDYIRKIPVGQVTTYKAVVDALGEGSPRTVGGVLRKNPFAPAAPCHRVIASNLFIGGFMGEWGKKSTIATKRKSETGTHPPKFMCEKKLDLLAAEGVAFDKNGKLKSRAYLWDGKTKSANSF